VRVLFIYPIPLETKKVYTGYYHGVGYLSSVLKAHGHETSLLILDTNDKNTVIERMETFLPDVVALSTFSNQMKLVKYVTCTIRSISSVPIIAGGIHATLVPEEVLAVEGITGVVRGEGEHALLEYVNALHDKKDVYGIANFMFLRKGTVVKNDVRALIDLDSLPFPDREIYGDYQTILTRNKNTIGAEFMIGRGCAYECGYCSNHKIKELYSGHSHGSFIRKRSVDNVIREMQCVLGRYTDISLIGFHDDIFPMDLDWLEEFAQKYSKKISLPFWCNARVDLLNEKNLRILKRAGCMRLHMGVESGSERIKKEILGRNITNQKVIDTFRLVKSMGFKTLAFNMIGIPEESQEDIEQTIALNKSIKPHWLLVSLFYPFPGTNLYSKCLQNGTLGSNDVESYYECNSSISNNQISREKLLFYYNNFVQLVYEK